MTGHALPNSDAIHTSGPLKFLHPTTRLHPVSVGKTQDQNQQQQQQQQQQPASPSTAADTTTQPEPASENGDSQANNDTTDQTVYHVWRSRDNRKGRRRAVITRPAAAAAAGDGTTTTAAAKQQPRREESQLWQTARGVTRLFTRFPVWDVSYLVAVDFVLGSVVWCINGSFVWLPLVAPSSEFPGEVDVGAGILAFIGATIFEIGSLLMMVEAINAERTDCFGWALEEELEDHGLRLRPKHEGCRHDQRDRRSLLKDSAVAAMAATAVDSVAEPGGLKEQEDEGSETRLVKERRWSWWPTWQELKTHYFREIGFLACLVQLFGATIFWISGFTALPPIYNALSDPAMNGAYWSPQVIGGSGFIISGIMFMIEVQDKWYKPAINRLGWHVGFWNMLGGIGFTLCPAVGYGSQTSTALEYASGLSTFIGSWAFLIGSIAQWYESLDKYPVSVQESSSWPPSPSGEKAV